MDIEAKFKEKYSKHLANFKTLSYDSKKNEHLCQNTTHRYYNFDDIVEERNYELTPASPDTLIFKDNKIYCVEFKNSFKEGIKDKIIKKKFENGYEVLSEIFTEFSLKLTDYQLIFCVVYKRSDEDETIEELETNRGKVHHGIKKPIIHFGLAQYIGGYYNEIVTNDVDFFRGQFIKKINLNIDLPC